MSVAYNAQIYFAVEQRFMAKDLTTPKEDALEAENAVLRVMLAQAGIDVNAAECIRWV